MIKHLLYLVPFVIMMSLASCKKQPSAGLGGAASLKLVAKHHGAIIDSVTFYVKFNASDAPSEDAYDLTQAGNTISPGDTYAIISGLKQGKYYLFAKGWDPSISNNVKGGIPYTISSDEMQEITVAVTEVH